MSKFRNMAIIETPKFNGTYEKKCPLFKDISIGGVHCVGYSDLGIKPCKHMISYKEKEAYYLPIMKENIPIVSEVVCGRNESQLDLFDLLEK